MLKIKESELMKWVVKLRFFRKLCQKKDKIIKAQQKQIEAIKDFYNQRSKND